MKVLSESYSMLWAAMSLPNKIVHAAIHILSAVCGAVQCPFLDTSNRPALF